MAHLINGELLGSIEFTILIEYIFIEKETDLITTVQEIIVSDMFFIS
jgi:hypothetical protein